MVKTYLVIYFNNHVFDFLEKEFSNAEMYVLYH